MQAHFLGLGHVPHDLKQNMERFTALDLDVAITELDVALQRPFTDAQLEQQAKDYAQMFEVCFNVSRCVGVTTWGLTDRYSWISQFINEKGAALMFDEQYREKPAYAAVKKVLMGVTP